MNKILNLEKLLSLNSAENEFDEKTKGFIRLNNKLDRIDYGDYPVVIPDLFKVSKNYEFNEEEMFDSFKELVGKFSKKRMVFMRTTDSANSIEKSITKELLINPDDISGSFENWKNIFKEIRGVSKRAVITQLFPKEMELFPTEIAWDFDKDLGKNVLKTEGFEAFGANLVSFFIQSKNRHYDKTVMLACEGLPTKIEALKIDLSVGGGCAVLFNLEGKLCALNTDELSSLGDNKGLNSGRPPLSRDLGIVKNGKVTIESINRSSLGDKLNSDGLDIREQSEYITVCDVLTPFKRSWVKGMEGSEKIPRSVLNLADKLKKGCKQEIELGGFTDGEKIYIYQLRFYDAPEVTPLDSKNLNPISVIYGKKTNRTNPDSKVYVVDKIPEKKPFVNPMFLEESKRWKSIYLDVLREGNFDFIKYGRSKNISKCQVSPPLIREKKDRDNGEFHVDKDNQIIGHGGTKNVGRYQILSNLVGNLSSDESTNQINNFMLSYPSKDEFKRPIIVNVGTEISANGQTSKLIDKINELGNDYRGNFNSDINIGTFLNNYLHICNDFVAEVNKRI